MDGRELDATFIIVHRTVMVLEAVMWLRENLYVSVMILTSVLLVNTNVNTVRTMENHVTVIHVTMTSIAQNFALVLGTVPMMCVTVDLMEEGETTVNYQVVQDGMKIVVVMVNVMLLMEVVHVTRDGKVMDVNSQIVPMIVTIEVFVIQLYLDLNVQVVK